MTTVTISSDGEGQIVRLPKEYRIDADEVEVNKVGSAVIIFPKGKGWEIMEQSLEKFSDDFMAEGRNQSGPVRDVEF